MHYSFFLFVTISNDDRKKHLPYLSELIFVELSVDLYNKKYLNKYKQFSTLVILKM